MDATSMLHVSVCDMLKLLRSCLHADRQCW